MTTEHDDQDGLPQHLTHTDRIAQLEAQLAEGDRTAERLLDSEKRYRRLFESAKDGILLLDADTGRIVDANPFLLALLGHTHEEVVGHFLWDLGSFRDIAASKEAFRTLQDNEYIRYDDLPLRTSGGQAIAVEFVGSVYLVDHQKVIQCNIRDITGRERAEAERKRLMAAIEQTGEVIMMTDPQGTIQFVNPAFESASGYTREEAIGKTPRLLKSGKQDEAFYRDLWETITGGQAWAGVMLNRRKDASLYSEETSISPVRDAVGKTVNFVAVKRDITEQLAMAAQLQQAQKMEAVGQLAGGVAHDYNNMLSVMLGYTELALGRVSPGEPLHGDLEGIHTAILRSAAITRQLLAFARKQVYTPVVLDLNESVQGLLGMMRRLIGENVSLTWKPGPGVCAALLDPAQITQILANLCINAKDAISELGTITIETRTVALDPTSSVVRAGRAAGDYVLLSVRDDGCGMDQETAQHIFEPFFTTKGPGHGTGLGLSTVYGIVRQSGGFITVLSEPGDGAAFEIYLPRHASPPVQVQVTPPQAMPRGSGETVLLVEDELTLLALGRLLLEDLGYRVLAAGTPLEALALADQHGSEIQLLITDVVMPEMNGRDLATQLISRHPGLGCLFMSGYTATVFGQLGIAQEAANFLQKPFSMKEFAAKVHASIQAKRA